MLPRPVLLRQREVAVTALDDEDARRVELLLAVRGGKDAVDGHVALCAHRTGHTILTGDPDELRRLAANARIERVWPGRYSSRHKSRPGRWSFA